MKKETLKRVLFTIALILVGSLLCALVIFGILIPKKLLAGGASGRVEKYYHSAGFPALLSSADLIKR